MAVTKRIFTVFRETAGKFGRPFRSLKIS